MPPVVTMFARMGDKKVVFKCATAVTLCVLHAGSPFRAFPSQCVRVVDRKKSPSFGLCQVDMYVIV